MGVEFNQLQSDLFQAFVSTHEKKFMDRHPLAPSDAAQKSADFPEISGTGSLGGDLYGFMHTL